MKTIHLPAETFYIPFEELAHLIADALWPEAGPDDPRWDYGCSRVGLDSELERAVKNGTLPVKNPRTFGPHTYPVGNALLSALVSVDDLREFVAERGLSVIVGAPAQSAAEPAPLAPSASDASAMNPPPVTTANIACAFDGLRGWDEKAWKDTLGTPPKWLEACIVLRGQRGVRVHHWNPVLIGAALVRNEQAQARSVRAKFQSKPQLADWLEAWRTYEADNFDTQ